jgi:hypothetical protein
MGDVPESVDSNEPVPGIRGAPHSGFSRLRRGTNFRFDDDVDTTMVEAAARFIVLTLGTFAGPSRFLDSHPAKHDDDQDHRHAEAEELNDVHRAINGEVWALHDPVQSRETNDHKDHGENQDRN